jgi:CubicO group peptidase (beta-lactamase class C family)
MKKTIAYLIVLLGITVLGESCQNTVGRSYGKKDYNKAKAYYDSLAFHREAILTSPETITMVKGLNNFYHHYLGKNFNGAMLVARKGVVIFERYQGFSNFADKTSITKQTTFQLASTSKPFTAMAVLYLQQQGQLRITDSIQRYFPKFPYKGVTIKSLLDHRSGLPNYLYFCGKYWNDRTKLMTNRDVIDLMIKYHPKAIYAPNTHYNYCNTNYAVLGALIEKITGERLGEYLKKVFFDPLGMKHTYVYNPNRDKTHAHQSLTYDYRTRPIPNECFDGVVGDKNVYSTVDDLLKWDQGLYDGKLFTKATLKAAFTPYSNEHPGIKNYGLGWHLLVYPDSSEIVYHNGWWHGNTSSFYRFIDDSTTLIILSNRFNKMVYYVQPVWKILHEATFAVDGDDDEG